MPRNPNLTPSTHPFFFVLQIASVEAFEDILKSAGDKLVVVMCKASGCRPCKTFRPRFGLLATLFSDASFYEVIGDRNDSTKTLMRSQKVRATPTFLFFRNGERVHDHSGIKAEKMLEALKATVLPGEAGYTEDFARAAEFLEAKPTN
jgi:thioredoxin 1